MLLEEYFTIHGPDDIRLAGSRIGIEHILYPYVFQARTAEEIAERFPTLRLDQVYATILSYLRNKDRLDAYLAEGLAWSRAERAQQATDPAWRAIEQRLATARQDRARTRKAIDQATS